MTDSATEYKDVRLPRGRGTTYNQPAQTSIVLTREGGAIPKVPSPTAKLPKEGGFSKSPPGSKKQIVKDNRKRSPDTSNLSNDMQAMSLNSRPSSSKLVIGDAKANTSINTLQVLNRSSPTTSTPISFADAIGSASSELTNTQPSNIDENFEKARPSSNSGPSYANAANWSGNNSRVWPSLDSNGPIMPCSTDAMADSFEFPLLPIAGRGRGRGRISH